MPARSHLELPSLALHLLGEALRRRLVLLRRPSGRRGRTRLLRLRARPPRPQRRQLRVHLCLARRQRGLVQRRGRLLAQLRAERGVVPLERRLQVAARACNRGTVEASGICFSAAAPGCAAALGQLDIGASAGAGPARERRARGGSPEEHGAVVRVGAGHEACGAGAAARGTPSAPGCAHVEAHAPSQAPHPPRTCPPHRTQ
jgi:hypothetical protein